MQWFLAQSVYQHAKDLAFYYAMSRWNLDETFVSHHNAQFFSVTD